MRTNLPAYPIVVEGITLQVGPVAAETASRLRGGVPLLSVYNLRTLSAPRVRITEASEVLGVVDPSLAAALFKLRDGDSLVDLTESQTLTLQACVDELREYMGSNNAKVAAMLVPQLPGNAMAQIEAYDKRFRERYGPLVADIKAKGLTVAEATAFLNCSPFHNDRVIVRTGNDWRYT